MAVIPSPPTRSSEQGQTFLDLVFAKLRALRINPSPLCSDSAFLRRAYLDAIGRLPDPTEARAFLNDRGADKRSQLIDRLVGRPEFADFWALKWADLLRNEEKTMGEKGAWVLERWLRDQIAKDTPLDELARRIVAGLGSTWQNPPSSFNRTNRDPMTAAESVSQVFLGIRLQCARCHNHPFDVWTQDDYFGLAAFFANVARKQWSNIRKDNLDSHEINGDEIIYLAGLPRIVQPRTGAVLGPKYPSGPDVDRSAGDGDNALDRLADWLTRNNPQFSRNLANRIWFHLLGRGIVAFYFNQLKKRLLPITDLAVPTLIQDLHARGLLDETLVVWMGEFGRTPMVQNTKQFGPDGRGHWPDCYTVLLAGGGIIPGAIYGSSDRIGAYPATDPVSPDDIAATMFWALGIDPVTEVRDTLGRPLPIAAGTPITRLFG